MLIAQALAGYSPEESDILRRAIGKKVFEEIETYRQRFINGMVAQKIDKNTAEKVFEQILEYGAYGFSKSHSAAYALLAYQSAYLKAHFREEYMNSWQQIFDQR